MQTEEETIGVIDGLLDCAHTLAALKYRGRALGSGEQAEYRRLLALLSRGRSLCDRLVSEAGAEKAEKKVKLF